MFYALSWFVIFSLLVLWSLGAWAVHAAAVWTVSNAGALTGASLGAEGLRLPEWLAPWVPPEIAQSLVSLLSGLAPAVEGLIQAMPALAGGLTVATWVIWVLGSALLEPAAAAAAPGSSFQFERLGYFCVDPQSTPQRPVFNRTVTLRDSWAKVAAEA